MVVVCDGKFGDLLLLTCCGEVLGMRADGCCRVLSGFFLYVINWVMTAPQCKNVCEGVLGDALATSGATERKLSQSCEKTWI